MRVVNRLWSFGLLVMLLGCAGGERKSGKVTGKVTLDNVPIEVGSLVFMTDDGKLSGTGTISAGGTYSVPDAPVGNVKITLSLPRPTEPPKPPDAPEIKDDPKKKDGAPKGPELPKEVQAAMETGAKLIAKIPPVYMNPVRTPLRFNVKDGENQHDIKLSSEGTGDATDPSAPPVPGTPPMPPMPPMPPPPPE